MQTAAERLSVFEDSEEVALSLERSARSPSGRAYWIPEASAHIVGLYELARQFAEELDARRRQE